MYICQVCGDYPDVNDRAAVVLTDSIRVEIKGHRDCISDISSQLDQIRDKSKKKMTVKALFKAIDMDIKNHLIDW